MHIIQDDTPQEFRCTGMASEDFPRVRLGRFVENGSSKRSFVPDHEKPVSSTPDADSSKAPEFNATKCLVLEWFRSLIRSAEEKRPVSMQLTDCSLRKHSVQRDVSTLIR